MNLFSLLVLLPATRAAVPVIYPWRRSLQARSSSSLVKSRHLQTCEGVGADVVGDLQEHYAENLGNASAIQCETFTVAGLGCRVVCKTIQYCCGDFCGSLEQSFYYSTELTTVSETTCVSYQASDSHELSGLTRCVEVDYCEDDEDDAKPCSCNAQVSGVPCTECSICDDETVPGTDIAFAVADCSNIGGDSLLDGECDDVDDEDSELLDLSLQCEEPTLPEGVDAIVIDTPPVSNTTEEQNDGALPVQDRTEDDEPIDVGPETSDLNATDGQAEADPALVAEQGDSSWETCNRTATYYLASAAVFNPNCTCTKSQGSQNYELHCRDDCLACYEQYCFQYSFSDFFNGMGNKIAWERCDGNICEFKDEQSGHRCFSIAGQACSCSGLCDVDCSNIQENLVFNRCTIEGNFGNFSEYFTEFYRSVYVKQEDLRRGTCMSSDESVDKGLVAGLVVAGISGIVAVTCFVIYFRRQSLQTKESLDSMNDETAKGEEIMELNKDEAEPEKAPAQDDSDGEHYKEPEKENDEDKEESDNEQPESAPEQAPPSLVVPARARSSRLFVFDTDSETESEA